MLHAESKSDLEPQVPSFPWSRALLVLLTLWLTVWVGSFLGGRAAIWIYEDRFAPPPPYSEAEMQTLERVAPTTFAVAQEDMAAWRETVDLGSSLARIEGTVVGGLALIGLWGAVGLFWLWNRERERHARMAFELADEI